MKEPTLDNMEMRLAQLGSLKNSHELDNSIRAHLEKTSPDEPPGGNQLLRSFDRGIEPVRVHCERDETLGCPLLSFADQLLGSIAAATLTPPGPTSYLDGSDGAALLLDNRSDPCAYHGRGPPHVVPDP